MGCGPATQLSQIAAMNPEIKFTGVDMSEELLRHARQHVTELGLDNVDFLLGDITALYQ
jgi:tRNA G46 methylase TrmB